MDQHTSELVLEVDGVSKRFGKSSARWAVHDVSFSLKRGEILGLLGPNGAGKTTTIRIIISVLRPENGSIRILGRDLASDRSWVLQRVAFASTYTNLPLYLTVQENLEIHGRLYGMSGPDRRSRIDELLGRFGVGDQRKKRVSQLSAGQRTRVMLAKAFMPRPALALLDEPTASLDPDIAAEVRRFVAEERKAQGTAILFSSHNMTEVTELCDRVVFLKDGKVIAIDEPRALAAKAGGSIVELEIDSGMTKAKEVFACFGTLVEERGRRLSGEVQEGLEGRLLVELTQQGVAYSRLNIHRPTLEDYFLLHSRPSEEVSR